MMKETNKSRKCGSTKSVGLASNTCGEWTLKIQLDVRCFNLFIVSDPSLWVPKDLRTSRMGSSQDETVRSGFLYRSWLEHQMQRE
jgi:hypothetical protein